MNEYQQQQPDDQSNKLQGSVQSMVEVDEGVEVKVRIRNPLDRAAHYIANVRGLIFDPATGRVRVQLTDQGRDIPPGSTAMEPQFRMIDPNSESEITIRLPKTIVKLADSPSPTGDLRFEEIAIADAQEIELEIGWADTPYYSDPREKSRGRSPVSSWEQESLNITFNPYEKQA